MAKSFFICTRNITGKNRFGNENGNPTYLAISRKKMVEAIENNQPRSVLDPQLKIGKKIWINKLMARAIRGEREGWSIGDILIYVHGYNNDLETVIKRHQILETQLEKAGFPGVLVSFDWPSAGHSFNYLEDRDDANDGAVQLVTSIFKPLAAYQKNRVENKCGVNVHMLGHSTGAYVIRNAFHAANGAAMQAINWNVGQVVFLAADISSRSMKADSEKSRYLFKKATRITNYVNPCDKVLAISNAKRLNLSRRLGRIGLPDDAPELCVDVFCNKHWESLKEKGKKPQKTMGIWSHSWHLYSDVLIQDLVATISGNRDRRVIPTRQVNQEEGYLELRP